MKATIIAHQQGTKDWHAHRATHLNASDCSAVMGLSSYKTRSQLLHEKATGIVPEIDAQTQRRFDAGHEFESIARPWAEEIIGSDLYPVVLAAEVEGMRLSASLDGLTMGNDVSWEHKTGRADLLTSLENGIIPDEYHPQMEMGLMLSGAEKCLFMASSGDRDAMRYAWYLPNSDLRSKIIAAWHQFEIDLREYQPQAVEVKPIGRTPETLPALHIAVTGMVTASNLAEFKAHALAVFEGINTDLVTDEDFSNAEKAVKWLGEVEDRLAAAKQHALSQTRDIDEMFRTIDDIMAESKRKRLDMDKTVKSRKEAMKTEIVTGARMALGQHIAALNDSLGQPLMPAISADFAGAIKGKKNFDSMRDAVNTMLAAAKVDANMVADRIQANLAILKEHESFGFLFSDVPVIALKQPDDLKLLVDARISNYRAAEAAKTAAAEEARAAKQRREEAALKAAIAVQPPVAPPPAATAPMAANQQVSLLAELNALLVRLSDSQIERVLHFVQSRYGAELGIDAGIFPQDRTAKTGYRTSGPRKLSA